MSWCNKKGTHHDVCIVRSREEEVVVEEESLFRG